MNSKNYEENKLGTIWISWSYYIDFMIHILQESNAELKMFIEDPLTLLTLLAYESYAIVPRWWTNNANLPLC
jgi:hypothetical protein